MGTEARARQNALPCMGFGLLHISGRPVRLDLDARDVFCQGRDGGPLAGDGAGAGTGTGEALRRVLAPAT
jgi:hypothetical protein